MVGDGLRAGRSSGAVTEIRPRGIVGDLLGRLAATMGAPVAGFLGADPAGDPFDPLASPPPPPPGAPSPHARPEGPAIAPQGIVGDLLGRLAPAVGAPLGGALRDPPADGRAAPRPPHPREAPPMAPQGFVGDLLGRLAQPVGAPVGRALPRGRADAP